MNRLIMSCKGILSSPSHRANRLSSAGPGSFQPVGNFNMQLLMQQYDSQEQQGNIKTKRNITNMAFNIKTTQDMLWLTCRDFSPLFTGTPQVLELNHFQLMFNQFRAAHACNTHLSWMNNTGPPTEHSGSLPHMPKHPFMLTTKKSLDFSCVLTVFDRLIVSLHLHCTN